MSHHTILVDGYNLAMRHPRWQGLRLEQMRDRVRDLLRQTRWPVPSPRVVAIFDAKSPEDSPGSDRGGIRFKFAASADAEIQQAIRGSDAPDRLAVVSDDGEIVRTAKSHRVRVYSCAWVVQHSAAAATAKGARPDPQETHDKGSLPAAQARSITEELERRWLRGDDAA